ncbi:hypothetical protein ABVK25_001821 [Lepraria finkii]|uniref:Uncharacterized protein n=1 Tax=Lepraria finkii TaxID=1340010 RepID=A0ABR4BKJ8_9LECA
MLRICDMRWLVNAFGWIRDVFSTPPFPLKESKPILEDAKVLDGEETAFKIEKSYIGEIHPEEPYLKEPELDKESEGVDDQWEPADDSNTEGSCGYGEGWETRWEAANPGTKLREG